jgi:uncharacterized cupin superfamily protein
MTDKIITRLLPDGQPGGGMKPLSYISADTVIEGTANEQGHIFFTNTAGNVNAGVWECTSCTERIRDYPYDQCCFVLEGSLTIVDEIGHAETFNPGDAFTVPRGFNGDWRMTERYKNFFVTVE